MHAFIIGPNCLLSILPFSSAKRPIPPQRASDSDCSPHFRLPLPALHRGLQPDHLVRPRAIHSSFPYPQRLSRDCHGQWRGKVLPTPPGTLGWSQGRCLRFGRRIQGVQETHTGQYSSCLHGLHAHFAATTPHCFFIINIHRTRRSWARIWIAFWPPAWAYECWPLTICIWKKARYVRACWRPKKCHFHSTIQFVLQDQAILRKSDQSFWLFTKFDF